MLNWIDTHTHIYMPDTIEAQDDSMQKAIEAGVDKVILAGVDVTSVNPTMDFCLRHPKNAFPSIGLHPTDVKENYKQELDTIGRILADNLSNPSATKKYIAVGETGIDLYWDKTFIKEQEEALQEQLSWAKQYNLPLIFHVRNGFEEAVRVIKKAQDGNLRGVFHCYSGSYEQAVRVIDLGFFIGICGVLTFKNASLAEIVQKIDIKHLLLETDAPFLAPVPYRGKPNESAYIPLIGVKLAEVKNLTIAEVAQITSSNAQKLFAI